MANKLPDSYRKTSFILTNDDIQKISSGTHEICGIVGNTVRLKARDLTHEEFSVLCDMEML